VGRLAATIPTQPYAAGRRLPGISFYQFKVLPKMLPWTTGKPLPQPSSPNPETLVSAGKHHRAPFVILVRTVINEHG